MKNVKARIIAHYLPQFHPIPENDKWWGKGFTEWTNVEKAKPLFKGHYQPRVPADLGYYDLRMPEIREAQAKMAREAGIEGFMYWHYWFGNGKQLMASIFEEVLKSGNPDFPFCLGWANHSWYAKEWNSDEIKKDKLLIEQTYPGELDYWNHFNKVLVAFKDSRYLKVGNMPIFLIFNTVDLPKEFIPSWNKWAREAGFIDGIYFIAQVNKHTVKSEELVHSYGFSAVTFSRTRELYSKKSKVGKVMFRIKGFLNKVLFHKPVFAMDYKKSYPHFIGDNERNEYVIPFLLPNWDHSPRSGMNGTVLINSTPALFKKHVIQVLDVVKKKKNKLVLLKSWNEWAEGNYMEPDLRFGMGYIKALREALDEVNNS